MAFNGVWTKLAIAHDGRLKMATKESGKFVQDSITKKVWVGPVIDLGAGHQSDRYRYWFGSARYDRLDIVAQAGGLTDIVADINHMPKVMSAFYGVVLLCETLEHLPNPFLAFKEASRILKIGGLFICTTVACWAIHRHPKDYFRFLPDGLQHLCQVNNLLPYFEFMDSKTATTPCHCCIAAIKAK